MRKCKTYYSGSDGFIKIGSVLLVLLILIGLDMIWALNVGDLIHKLIADAGEGITRVFSVITNYFSSGE